MAKYRVTVEMYQEFLKGENAHLAGTQQRRSIELVSNAEPGRWAPVDP